MRFLFLIVFAALTSGCSSLNEYMWEVQEPVFNPVHAPVDIWVDSTYDNGKLKVRF